jgi:hypothetical protein
MSELKIDKVSPRTGTYVSLNTVGSKNIIINGDMSIAQRSTSVASITSSGYYTLDRHRLAISSLGTWTQSQSTDVPAGQGFATSLKMDCTTADAAPAASDVMWVQHRIEGQNLQYIKKGTANAESLTLSFWVKSNKTGTYIAELEDTDNSRHIAKSYTVDVTDTWEKKTITYAGDTTGTLTNDNNTSLELHLYLGAGTNYTSGTLATSWSSNTDANRAVGQVNLADNTANEWYITGVQLEAGTTASDFEFLPVDVNLDRCFRYYEVLVDGDDYGIAMAAMRTTQFANGLVFFKKQKRASPSIDQVSGSNYYTLFNGAFTDTFDSFTGVQSTNNSIRVSNTDIVSITAGDAGWFESNNASSFIAFDAEL